MTKRKTIAKKAADNSDYQHEDDLNLPGHEEDSEDTDDTDDTDDEEVGKPAEPEAQDVFGSRELIAMGFTRRGRYTFHHPVLDGVLLTERVPGEYLVYLAELNKPLGKPLTSAEDVRMFARVLYKSELGKQ